MIIPKSRIGKANETLKAKLVGLGKIQEGCSMIKELGGGVL